jgi:hypothetical protein
MSRRPGCLAWASLVSVACGGASPVPPPPRRATAATPPLAEIISCVDLPRGDPRSHNLSGLAWDPAAQRLFAISDRDKWITVLSPRPGFTGFDLLPAIALDIPLALDAWDGEALAIAGDRFLLVANETLAAVFSVDRAGRGAKQLPLPGFPGLRDNLGLEALGYVASAEGGYVLAINEQALEGDGPTSTTEHGTVVRILRHPLDGSTDLEVAYLTDPVFAAGSPSDNGVSDLAPLSADRLLLIERGWVQGKGNSVRIYDVDLRDAPNIIALPDAREAAPVHKRLVVDLATLPDDLCPTPPAPQRRRTLDNYEGLALGPTLADGRQLVFLVTDDNIRPTQVARVLTVALAPGAL